MEIQTTVLKMALMLSGMKMVTVILSIVVQAQMAAAVLWLVTLVSLWMQMTFSALMYSQELKQIKTIIIINY
jgi:hypothetical protein